MLRATSIFIALSFLTCALGCSRPSATTSANAAPSSTATSTGTLNVEISSEQTLTITGPIDAGYLENPIIVEASGLACSNRSNNILWTHNDSGNDPAIYAISPTGKNLGSVWPAGADNIDWEDIASFTLNGHPYILIADVGDNNGKRKNCSLYIIEEPAPDQLSPDKELIVPIAWNIPINYPDGSHDCEAVAVDPGPAPDGSEGKVYLLIKRTYPARLYTVPLIPRDTTTPQIVKFGAPNPPPKSPPQTPPARPTAPTRPTTSPEIPLQTARLIGKLPAIPQPTSAQNLLPIPTGQYRGMPTGMDFSPDGRMAVILTYGDVLLYVRRENESWLTTLLRDPIILPPHKLGQAEGVCFSRDGKSIYVTEEKKNAPLLRYDLK